jgi:hypothetical protein
MPAETRPTVYTVTGIIFNASGNPLANAIVKVFDKDLRSEQLLGEKITDAKGGYTIEFNSRRAENPEHEAVDIFIKVFDAAGSLLGQSPIHFNIEGNTNIDYTIGSNNVKGISEFDNLVKKIRPVIEPQQVPLGKLEENGHYQDISFLAGELRENEERISMINKAFNLSEQTRLAPDIFYAWLRAGLPAEWSSLLQVRTGSLISALKEGMDKNIIADRWGTELDKIAKTMNAYASGDILDSVNTGTTVYKKVMGTALSADQQKIFFDTYLSTEDAPENFWKELKQQPGFSDEPTIEKTKRALSINLLTKNQPELTNVLFNLQQRDAELKDMKGFAKFDRNDWKELIRNAGVAEFPAGIKGDTTEDKINNYAALLENTNKEVHAASFFANRLKADTASSFTAKNELMTFFEKNPGFNLQTNTIHADLEKADFNGINDRTVFQKELKKLNRLFKLSTDYGMVNAMNKESLHSANDIVKKYGRRKFAQTFAAAAGTEAKAKEIYDKAMQVDKRTTALFTAYKMRHDIPLYAMTGNRPAPEGYHEMFSDGELCDCEHCQSVYSPSAYLVDMLAFLQSENLDAYNELVKRRPDLIHILLTCKNTNTALPYIDLVNELLEKQVVLRSGTPDTEGITAGTHSWQTVGESTDLLAIPENMSVNAYKVLADKMVNGETLFAASLPFDLALEEMRTYTDKLGYKRVDLLEQYYGKTNGGKWNDPSLAAELFELTETELGLISGQQTFTLNLPANLKGLLEITKFTYTELLQLLESYFLNPLTGNTRTITIDASTVSGFSCDLDKLKLAGADNEWFAKAARYWRLWKRTGWDFFDFDRMLVNLLQEPGQSTIHFPDPSEFNVRVLVPFFQAEKICRKLKLQRRQVIALLGNIDHVIYFDRTKKEAAKIPSLYEQQFRNKAIIDIDPASPFTVLPLTGDLHSHKEIIAAVLGIAVTELEMLVEPAESLSLESLSYLYREVVVAKAMGLGLSEFRDFLAITNKRSAGRIWLPGSLLEFLEEVELFRAKGITATVYNEFINEKTDPSFTLPVDETIAAWNNRTLLQLLQESTLALKAIKSGTGTEEEKKEKADQAIDQWQENLTGHNTLNAAMTKELKNPDDIALAAALEALDKKNKELLRSLSLDKLIEKWENTEKKLVNYLFYKNTPPLFRRLGFSTEEINWLGLQKMKLGISSLWETSPAPAEDFAAFKKLIHLARLAGIKTAMGNWREPIDILITNANDAKTTFFESLISLYKISETSLTFLLGAKEKLNHPDDPGQLQLHFPEDCIGEMTRIIACAKSAGKMKANVQQLTALTKLNLKTTETWRELVQPVKNLLKAGYNNTEWLKFIKPVNNKFRIRRRDALLDWLLINPGNNDRFGSAAAITTTLLIDVEMDACMVTSRTKQAISSVQLFIDRCLLDLEPGIKLDKEFADQWQKWRKHYRYWEANRKVFLYPENWIEPELRDNKSPFFKELESQLSQNEVTNETAKEALLTYLVKLDTVSNLQTVGLFKDEEKNTLFVIGRTHNIPHQYYHRKLQGGAWSAWEKIELDIEGDHILPVVWRGRLMLVWALFTEKQEQGAGTTISKADAKGTMSMQSAPVVTYLEMKIAWSEYKNGKWSGKKISAEKIPNFSPVDTLKLGENQISLSSEIIEDRLLINAIIPQTTNVQTDVMCNSLGGFVFDSCHSAPKFIVSPHVRGPLPPIFAYRLLDKELDKIWMAEKSNVNNLTLFASGAYRNHYTGPNSNKYPVFAKTPGLYQLLPDHHEIGKDKPVYFFFSNTKHNFFAYSKDEINRKTPVSELGNVLTDRLMRHGFTLATSPTPAPEPERGGTRIMARMISPMRDVVSPDLIREVDTVLDPVREYKGRKFVFQPFYHPYTCSYIKKAQLFGIDALYDAALQERPAEYILTDAEYAPTQVVTAPFPKEEVDFSFGGAYSMYNWELFYHIPVLIATKLSQNLRFEEARKWFHYIFDPTKYTNGVAGAEKFWITKPFRQEIREGIDPIDKLLMNEEFRNELAAQVDNWANDPFNPHSIARMRVSAYMRNTIVKYIDNLIRWGDQLFLRDTIESINEATLLYMLAAEILGKKPTEVSAGRKAAPMSFAAIETNTANGLDKFSNFRAELELVAGQTSSSANEDNLRIPYFGLPKNENLLKYWDTISDRLFKIRHCMNMAGVVRQLSLFDVAIDPALLVKATAAGLDLNDILADNDRLLPHYRFSVMLQKANELCSDVKMLGNNFLSVLEKKDAEELVLFRAGHEVKMLSMIRSIKEKQREEAKENLNSLLAARITIEERLNYYESRPFINMWEAMYFASSHIGLGLQTSSAEAKLLAAILHKIPDMKAGAPTTAGATSGGSTIGAGADTASEGLSTFAQINNFIGLVSNTMGSYHRRMDDWKFQAKTAELELKQMDKQILAAEIRYAMTEKELENHDLQTEQAEQVQEFLRSKFTNKDLYDWMSDKLFTLYRQCYQLAYATAKKAEKCLQYELGTENASLIQHGNWDTLKKGLVSGEQLQYDLRRLEMSYLEENKRELEITKHISLAQLDPLQVFELRTTGSCRINLPEELFDLDFPGHYFRRIRSISISLPCIAGPYASVNATLKLLNNKFRTKMEADPYGQTVEETTNWNAGRFRTGASRSTTIATSTAQNDSGIFELNFRDERYLPFEGAGAISQWSFGLNTTFRQFDYDTIADVIIHLRYTAREETTDSQVQAKVNDHLKEMMKTAETNERGGRSRMISFRQDFPNSFHQLLSTDPQKTEIEITSNHFERVLDGKKLTIRTASVFAIPVAGAELEDLPNLKFTMDIGQQVAETTGWSPLPGNIKRAGINLEGVVPLDKIIIECTNGTAEWSKDKIKDLLLLLELKVEEPEN